MKGGGCEIKIKGKLRVRSIRRLACEIYYGRCLSEGLAWRDGVREMCGTL